MKISGDFRAKVLARKWVGGSFINLGSALTAEIAGNCGYDWLLLDHEHGAGSDETLRQQLQAAGCTASVPIVRIAYNEIARFKRALDLGAHGIMVPWVNTAAEAAAAVSATRYPPRGVRGVAKFNRGAGFGTTFEEYYTHAHEWITLATQIETPEGVANADAIAAVDGVDVLFVGPTDLSYTMGIRDQLSHPKFVEALKQVADAARRHGKAAGILVQTQDMVEKCRDLGYTFMALGSDGGSVAAGLKANAQILKQTAK
jgi:2-keto-3-deoxy-L-rhamnonate aldolase RhmA